jgi:hypothetical protein
MKAQVAQDLRAKTITQADILKSDHAFLRKVPSGRIRPVGRGFAPASNLTPDAGRQERGGFGFHFLNKSTVRLAQYRF